MRTMKHSLGDIVRTLNKRILELQEQRLQEQRLTMDCVMYGLMLGLIEARDLIMEEAP